MTRRSNLLDFSIIEIEYHVLRFESELKGSRCICIFWHMYILNRFNNHRGQKTFFFCWEHQWRWIIDTGDGVPRGSPAWPGAVWRAGFESTPFITRYWSKYASCQQSLSLVPQKSLTRKLAVSNRGINVSSIYSNTRSGSTTTIFVVIIFISIVFIVIFVISFNFNIFIFKVFIIVVFSIILIFMIIVCIIYFAISFIISSISYSVLFWSLFLFLIVVAGVAVVNLWAGVSGGYIALESPPCESLLPLWRIESFSLPNRFTRSSFSRGMLFASFHVQRPSRLTMFPFN